MMQDKEDQELRAYLHARRQYDKYRVPEPELSLEKKFRLLDAMYEFARSMGAFPLENPMEGIEVDIRIARVVNSVSEAPEKYREDTEEK
ncbi:MAG TPA: hypothetical protein VKA68_04475 [bacterium]|nr:hypothetical protein [bacterium]